MDVCFPLSFIRISEALTSAISVASIVCIPMSPLVNKTLNVPVTHLSGMHPRCRGAPAGSWQSEHPSWLCSHHGHVALELGGPHLHLQRLIPSFLRGLTWEVLARKT